MNLGLNGRSAVVLASSDGLGLAVARALFDEGAAVALSGRDPERLARAVGGFSASPGRLFGDTLDVTDGDALAQHLARAAERHGPVEVLVLNAGGPPPGAAADVSDEDLDRAFELSFRSAVRAVRAVLPGMRERGFGRIVALTSSSVREPIANLVGSNAMRAGLTGYLKTLSDEVAADGVTVNSVCTGMFATDRLRSLFTARAERAGTTVEAAEEAARERIPAGRFGDPAELAAAVAFLASDRAAYLTGVALPVDGGAARALF